MTVYIGNAFSLQMVAKENLSKILLRPVNKILDVQKMVSIVGHADLAKIIGVEMNRTSITLNPGDVLYVVQLIGGRLPEGTTALPKGFEFEWISVEVTE